MPRAPWSSLEIDRSLMAYLEYVKKMSVGSEEIHSVLHIRERRGLPLVHRFYSDVVVVVIVGVVEVAVDVVI